MDNLTERLLGENFEEALKEMYLFTHPAIALAEAVRELHARLRTAEAEGAAEALDELAQDIDKETTDEEFFRGVLTTADVRDRAAAIRKGIEGQPPALGITDGEILDWLHIKGIATQEDGGTFAAKNMGVHSWRDEGAGVLRWTARWINSECKSLREAARIAITAERGGR